MTTRIKICGTTNLEDARLAVELGADALGFIFYPASPRAVTVPVATEICRALRPFVDRVGVFVNASAGEIASAQRDCRLTAIQLHGDEPPAFCRQFSVPVIKAIRVHNDASLAAAREYDVDALLLDAYTESQRGGTGRTFDWSLALGATKTLTCPVILSGGLTAENVGQAVRQVGPYAVDVASGVERAPGQKDPGKLERFIAAVRAADAAP